MNLDQHAPGSPSPLQALRQLPRQTAGAGFGLLAGVRVLDLTTSVAGPYAAMLLADFGAEVIKIERPGGDDSRGWGPPFLNGQALWFTAVNRNKKSVVLDLTTEAGRADLTGLVKTADVVITNQPPSVQKKLKLDGESLQALRKDLIFASITGFGLTGRRANQTCYDLIAEGYSGIMDITGPLGGDPQKVGAPAADMLAGQDAAMSVLAALYDRKHSGKGRIIDISLVDSMVRFLTCRLSAYLGSDEVPTRTGGTDSVIAIYQPFNTADEPLNLALGNDAIWARFWQLLGRPDYAARPEFKTNADRREHRAEIVAEIQSILLTRRRDDWLADFAAARVPAGPINSLDKVAADPDLQARGLFYAVQAPSGDLVPQIGLGIRIDGAAAGLRLLPPLLGEHTEEILRCPARAAAQD